MADPKTAPPPQAAQSPGNSIVLRRNSVVRTPSQLSLCRNRDFSSSSFSSSCAATASSDLSSASSHGDLGFELFSMKQVQYTSLKDLLPSAAAANSPRATPPPGSHHGSDILIRNRLVQQAAWAYLQPMSTSPESSGQSFLRKLGHRFSPNSSVVALLEFVDRHILLPLTRAVDCLFCSIGIRRLRC
ncbi:unnamed protein product [Cuscuta campestris]|uniref:Uncharacterized protein n=2 Tax=Cuscuta sect. Cleistogrammica TaxID=1824901 RepID=A0A484LCS5_9ASTE|nr:hypothetical protein DM860_010450 [Cuscuta australis]VFQ74170.1 unnamed protein product [Cuscuta campestris]